MRHRQLVGVAVTAVAMIAVVATRGARAQEESLADAVRRDDAAAVRALLEAETDPNARDDAGATALMWAAAVGSPDVLRVLLDRGADVNAATGAGATALMWATGDAGKVRVLIDRGATVGAVTRDGTTALVTAARRGNLEAMRVLLAAGADPGASARESAELLRIVHSDHPETRPILAEAGLELSDLAESGPPNLAAYPASNPAVMAALLDMGADPNPRGRFPLVGTAAFQGHLDTVRLLIDRGANLQTTGQHAVTPLMMAAAAPRPDPAIVELLIERGADLEARDEAGRTALDWAMLHGETPAVRVLRNAGAPGQPPPPPPAPRSRPRTVREAVAAGIERLQPLSPVSYEHTTCISCHHQTLPLTAMTLAKTRGAEVDEQVLAHPIRAIHDVWAGRRESLMLARNRDGGGANELTYGLLALAEAGVAPDGVTDVAVVNLLATQNPDGSWVFLDTRPPQTDNSPVSFTAMAIRVLDVYGPPGLRDAVETSRGRALAYLRTTSPATTQDEAFRLLGLVWARVAEEEAVAQVQRLLALQRGDGGWGQLPTMAPDAYATGQALYALRAGGMPASDMAYQRGVAFLLRTQLDDGSWFVRSRAFGFQPYFETGFPHGADQFISASATSWAVIALSHAL